VPSSALTWGALYSTVVVATTFSRSLIAHPSGWKQFPFMKHPWGVCTCFSFFLDNLFWGAWNDHFWSWVAIYIKHLVTAWRDVTHNALQNNYSSSWVEQCSRKTDFTQLC
jgi:hypothetical protein